MDGKIVRARKDCEMGVLLEAAYKDAIGILMDLIMRKERQASVWSVCSLKGPFIRLHSRLSPNARKRYRVIAL